SCMSAAVELHVVRHLGRDFKRRAFAARGIRTDPKREPRWFNAKPVLYAPQCECLRRHAERHPLRFSWSQRNRLETLKSTNRLGNTGPLQSDVQLHRLLARSGTGIGYVRAHRPVSIRRMALVGQRFVRSLSAQRLNVGLSGSVAKVGVRQSVPKWKLRAVLFVDIARDKLLNSVPRWMG